jgi:hypothetical protein
MKHTIEDTISDLAVRHIKDKLSTWLDSLTLPTPQSSMSSGQENISTSPCNATNEHVHPSVTIEIASTLPNADTDVRKKALVIGINYYAMQKAFGLSNPNSPKGSSASLHASPQSPQGLAQGSLQGLVQGSLQGLAQGSLHGSRLFVSDDVNINNAHEMYLLCREVGYNNVCVLFDSPGDPEQVIEEIVEAASSDDDFETVSEDEYKNISENFVTPPAFPNNRLDNIAPMPPKYDGWCGIVPPPESPIGSYVPTRENILRALGWLLTDSTHVVLYFSGKTDLLCSSPTGAIMSSDGHERGPICFDDILNVIRTSNVISARIIVDSKCAFGLIPQKHMLTEVSTSEDIGRNVFKLVTSPSVEAYDKDIISIYPDTSGSLSYQCAMTHILAKLILSKHKSADIYTICVALREELNSAGYMVSPCISSDRELTSSDIVIA